MMLLMVIVMVVVRHCYDLARQVAQLIPNQAATERAQPVSTARVEVFFGYGIHWSFSQRVLCDDSTDSFSS
jgi:hypothetical protein